VLHTNNYPDAGHHQNIPAYNFVIGLLLENSFVIMFRTEKEQQKLGKNIMSLMQITNLILSACNVLLKLLAEMKFSVKMVMSFTTAAFYQTASSSQCCRNVQC